MVERDDSGVLRVGLTGGIATGKSHVLAEFQELGAFGIDADVLARRVVEKGKPAYQEIVREFGVEILRDDGAIDRRKLGRIIFGDEARRNRLNAIVHPHVYEEESAEVAAILAGNSRRPLIVITDAALIIETGSDRRYDRIVVVFCRPELQLARLAGRDEMSKREAEQRIRSQMPIAEKVRYGHYVIDTSGEYAETGEQVRRVYRSLLADAAERVKT